MASRTKKDPIKELIAYVEQRISQSGRLKDPADAHAVAADIVAKTVPEAAHLVAVEAAQLVAAEATQYRK